MNRSRPFLNSLNDLKAHMSTKAKAPDKATNHYDTLKVKRNSTQNDIKTAYYELSKKYHPDRNTSADAKKIFQNLSDAYEVLGNFSKRKEYDRDLLARGDRTTRMSTTYRSPSSETVQEDDPLSEAYINRMANYNPLRPGDKREANFNFDAWTRAHYGYNLNRSLDRKQAKAARAEALRQERAEDERQTKSSIVITLTASISIIIFLLSVSFSDYDKNYITDRKSKDKNS